MGAAHGGCCCVAVRVGPGRGGRRCRVGGREERVGEIVRGRGEVLRLAARGGVRLVLLGRVRAGERRPRVPAACRRGRERRRREGRAGRGRGGRRLPGGGGGGDGWEPLRRARRGCRSRAWSVGGHARSHTQWLAGRTKPSLSSWLTSAGERPLERIHAVCASLLFPPRHTILCPERPIWRTSDPANHSWPTPAHANSCQLEPAHCCPVGRGVFLALEPPPTCQALSPPAGTAAKHCFRSAVCLSQSRGLSPQRSLCARACAAPVPERARLELQSSPATQICAMKARLLRLPTQEREQRCRFLRDSRWGRREALIGAGRESGARSVGHRAARLVEVGPLFARRHPVLVRFARAELPLSDELERDERARPSSRRAAFSSCTFSRPRSACSSP